MQTSFVIPPNSTVPILMPKPVSSRRTTLPGTPRHMVSSPWPELVPRPARARAKPKTEALPALFARARPGPRRLVPLEARPPPRAPRSWTIRFQDMSSHPPAPAQLRRRHHDLTGPDASVPWGDLPVQEDLEAGILEPVRHERGETAIQEAAPRERDAPVSGETGHGKDPFRERVVEASRDPRNGDSPAEILEDRVDQRPPVQLPPHGGHLPVRSEERRVGKAGRP